MPATHRQIFNERIYISFQEKIDFGLLVFDCFSQFGDPKLQPLYFAADINSVDHLPVLGFTENTKLYAADKNGGIHNLELGLVCLEKFDTTKEGPCYKWQRVCEVDNHAGEHIFVVELAVVLPYY
jgi:hypothetical protein